MLLIPFKRQKCMKQGRGLGLQKRRLTTPRGSWELRAQPRQAGLPALMEGGLARGWVSRSHTQAGTNLVGRRE